MSAKHAGTRKWQKIINHETDSAINTTNLEFNNAFSANYSRPLFQETFLYQVFLVCNLLASNVVVIL